MPDFAYIAIESGTGRERAGTVVSENPVSATADLKSRGLAPTSLLRNEPRAAPKKGVEGSGAAKWPTWTLGRGVSAQGLALFTRQLATLLKAGMPLLRALEVLARPERNKAFKGVILELAEAIRSGGNLSDGLRAQPKIFDELYVTMVKAGEAGGVLENVTSRLAWFLERTERIKGRVKSAMTYPAIILVVAGSILTGLLIFVVPKFQQIFSGVLKGQPLPHLTRVVIGAGEFIRHNLGLILGVIGLSYWGFILVRRSRKGRRLIDSLLLKSPFLGDLFLKAAVARFTRTFGSLLSSGVPILDALMLTRAAAGNVHIADALVVAHDRVREGGSIARALETARVFPGLVTSLIEVGEETGDVPEMLGRIADTYDEEVDNAVAALTSIIEPIMIVLMALVVGLIVIALFLPMVGIIQHLQ